MSYEPIKKEIIDELFQSFSLLYEEKGLTEEITFVVVGGASIIMDHEYRESTMDIDAYYKPTEQIKEIIESISKSKNVAKDWLNNDFTNTSSFTEKLCKIANFYKRFGKYIIVKKVSGPYLLAMKAKSSRVVGNDINDIIFMVYEFRAMNAKITYQDVYNSFLYLYGEPVSYSEKKFLAKALECFEQPIDEVNDILEHNRDMRSILKK